MSQFPRRPLKHGDIYPAHILRDEYGMNADNRPYFNIVAEQVPEELRELIPLVERWTIKCDVTRMDYFDHQPQQDIANFYYAVEPFIDRIKSWIANQPESILDWSEAAVYYLYFLKAHAEAYHTAYPPAPPTEDELRDRMQRAAERQYEFELQRAILYAGEAFSAQKYDLVVELLTPFANELGKLWAAKLAFASKKARSNGIEPKNDTET